MREVAPVDRCDAPGPLLPSKGMERRRRGRAPKRWIAIRNALLMFAGLSSEGCVDIKGGAVEVPWAIFAPDGHAITDCACAVESPAGAQPIAYVRLNLVSNPDPAGAKPCDGIDSCRFTCSHKIGATPFMIPEGQYQMSLTPLAADGTVLAIPSTAPVLRPVTRGQPTELEAFVFTASCASRCNGGSATQPCTGG